MGVHLVMAGRAASVSPFDFVALLVLVASWLFYERMLPILVGKRGALNARMVQIRRLWMLQVAHRSVRIADGQFIGHTLNSAAFFGSANLIVMAAVIGVMFGGESAYTSVAGLKFMQAGSHWLFEIKLMAVIVILSRGLLDFVWSIRQLNYCLAAIGAMPDNPPDDQRRIWGVAIGDLINPAMSTFSRGVRGYYFSLAAAAWMFGPTALLLVTIGTVSILVWRQSRSGAAEGVSKVFALVEETMKMDPPTGAAPQIEPAQSIEGLTPPTT